MICFGMDVFVDEQRWSQGLFIYFYFVTVVLILLFFGFGFLQNGWKQFFFVGFAHALNLMNEFWNLFQTHMHILVLASTQGRTHVAFTAKQK